MHLNHLNVIFAQATASVQTGAQGGTPGSPVQTLFGNPIVFFVLIFVMMYFVMIRPQQKRAKELAKLLAALKSGDKVATAAGIIGTIITVKEKSVTLRSADAKFEVTKASVTEILDASTPTES